MLARITRLFPLWAVLVSVAAYSAPASVTGIAPHVTTLLTIIMLSMGVTLSIDDFRRVFTRPAPVVAGIVLHYLVMPLAAWVIAKALHMPPDLTAGMVLVGSVASGTASNVMIYLARGDVALSVTISALSTLVGVFATPLLTRLYVDASIAVDVHGMLMSIVQIVALPKRGATMAVSIRARLRDVFRDAITHGLIEAGKNPVESVLRPKIEVARMRMTEEMFWAIYKNASHQWLKNALLLALLTGQRVSDVCKMRFDDVRDGFLWVDQQKKAGKTKIKIPLSVSLGEYSIASVVSQCRDDVVSRFLIHHRSGRYAKMRGKQVPYATLNNEFIDARALANIEVPDGLTPTTFHEIRSLTARMHAEQNGEKFTQALLGHRSMAMTELYIDVRGQQWVEIKLPQKAG